MRSFHVCLFMLLSSMVGTFLALDAILFYIFFEFYAHSDVLDGRRVGWEAFVSTRDHEVLYLHDGRLAIHVDRHHCFDLHVQEQFGAMSASLLDFYKLQIPFVAGEFLNTQTLFLSLFQWPSRSKCRCFPVHTLVARCTRRSSHSRSVLLAAVMLKMGTYGFMRFVLPIFPEATEYFAWVFMLLGWWHCLRSPCGHGPARHQKARRLFVGLAHGLRDDRTLCT